MSEQTKPPTADDVMTGQRAGRCAQAPGSESPDLLVRLEADRAHTKAKIKRYQARLRDLNMVIGRLKEDREAQKQGAD